jgi:hypothetical protein
MSNQNLNRRQFMSLIGVSAVGSGLILPGTSFGQPYKSDETNINHIGPAEGYTPLIGTLISMLEWISASVVRATKDLATEQLDYLHDKDSNTIGSLMMHVAATEVVYQDLTFNNLSDFSKENKEKWGVAMTLESEAREKIKGNKLEYYLDAMRQVRTKTKEEMKKRDDNWLLSGETKEWNWNNYCKWFHVTEHFANHRGQMTWYRKRLPK